jgi:hypothetical protein
VKHLLMRRRTFCYAENPEKLKCPECIKLLNLEALYGKQPSIVPLKQTIDWAGLLPWFSGLFAIIHQRLESMLFSPHMSKAGLHRFVIVVFQISLPDSDTLSN